MNVSKVVTEVLALSLREYVFAGSSGDWDTGRCVVTVCCGSVRDRLTKSFCRFLNMRGTGKHPKRIRGFLFEAEVFVNGETLEGLRGSG
jgi:hypothetical protein